MDSSRLTYAKSVSQTCLRCHYAHAVLTTPLKRSYCVLILPYPHYAFLNMFKIDHVLHIHEDLTTLVWVSTTLLLRPTGSYCVHQVLKDAVRTWLSVKGVLEAL